MSFVNIKKKFTRKVAVRWANACFQLPMACAVVQYLHGDYSRCHIIKNSTFPSDFK